MKKSDLYAPSPETKRLSVDVSLDVLTGKLGMPEDEALNFLKLRKRYLDKPLVDWEKVEEPPLDFLHKYEELQEPNKARIKELLGKLVVVALNGGLGTGMGLHGTKSVLQILKTANSPTALTFLDCKVMQIEYLNNEYDVDIPLVLMNSFNTDEESKKIVKKYEGRKVTIRTFLQSKFPLMYRDTCAPFPTKPTEKDNFYPPGSGEFFYCFQRCGLLDEFKKQGKDYVFISNVENLGATVDTKILEYCAASKNEYLLEVTNRISTDTTGGLPIKYKDNNVHILEMQQIPPEQHALFGVTNFRYWNTNNIWVKLGAIQQKLKEGTLDIDFTVKERSVSGRAVMQLETPASMAIHSFDFKAAILVSRTRYKPIKTTSQLLQVQSDLYEIENGCLVMNSLRVPPTEPIVKLGEEFRFMDNYDKRFKSIPNLLELDHLTVAGNVTFGANVTLRGTVIIVADTGSRIEIPDGAVLENKILAGNLQILDH